MGLNVKSGVLVAFGAICLCAIVYALPAEKAVRREGLGASGDVSAAAAGSASVPGAATSQNGAIAVYRGVAVELDGKQFGPDFERLRTAARSGNALAAMQAVKLIDRCQYARQRAELRIETAAVSGQEGGAARADIANKAQDDVEYCAKFSPQAIDEKADLVKQAARAGDLDAKVLFPAVVFADMERRRALVSESELATKYKAESLLHLNDALVAGRTDAMTVLAYAHIDGTLAARDKVKGLSYLMVLVQYKAAPLTEDYMKKLMGGMTAEEVQRARQYALQIKSTIK